MGNFWKNFFRVLAVIFLIGTINAIIQGVVDGKIYPATLFFAVIIAGAFCFLVYKVADYREKFRVLKDLENKDKELEIQCRELKGFYFDIDLSTEDINLFKEIELENIMGEIKDDNFQKLLIRNKEILSELRTGLSMLCKYGKEFTVIEIEKFIPVEISYTNLFYDTIKRINEKRFYLEEEKREHVLNMLYNDLVLFSEEILYKYEIFKKEYLPKIKVDLELIARVEEAKKFQLLQNMEEEDKQASRHIPQKIKDIVWNRDGGKCVECGSNQKIEFDHIIPFSKGGANTARNLQLLCESCNRSKSDKIG